MRTKGWEEKSDATGFGIVEQIGKAKQLVKTASSKTILHIKVIIVLNYVLLTTCSIYFWCTLTAVFFFSWKINGYPQSTSPHIKEKKNGPAIMDDVEYNHLITTKME